MINALFLSFGTAEGWDQTKNKEIPINKNKKSQTGPNSQFGGVNDGLFIAVYQVLTELAVKIEPITPANWQTITLANSLINPFIFLF